MILFSRKTAQGWRRILNRSRRDHKRERNQRTSDVKLSVRRGAAPNHTTQACSAGRDALMLGCRDSCRASRKRIQMKKQAKRLVLAEETKQSAQAMSFLQKAKNVTIIAEVKEIHSFLPGLELGMT